MPLIFSSPIAVRIGIAGAGAMGSGIALTALLKDMYVTLYDISPGMLEQAKAYLDKHLIKKDKTANLRRLDLVTELEALRGVNILIEAVPEDIDLKKELFARLDTILPAPAILATNTSTLSVTAIAASVQSPERVAGMHFFNPAPVLPLVEIVRGAHTSEDTLESLIALANYLDKTPVTARDTPGFIVNRVARPFYGEALRILGENIADHTAVDRLVRMGAGFRMGPFQLMDLIGIDVNLAAMRSMWEQSFGEPRYRPHQIQIRMVEQGALGRKTRHGFYDYQSEPSFEDPSPSQVKVGGDCLLFASGDWAPGLEEACQEVGHELLPYQKAKGKGKEQPFAGLVISSRETGLADAVANMERLLNPEALVLCQCVNITLAEIASQMEHPERLVGFNGLFIQQGKALELVQLPLTTSNSRNAAEIFFTSLGRTGVWIEDGPGLVLPRILSMLANEGAFAYMDGVAEAETIDRAMRLGVNYPFGPLEWAQKIGHAKIVSILDHLFNEYHEDRYRAAPILRRWSRLFPASIPHFLVP
jgi:3-hydroxybutyryl-CoA dehydrogenase